MTVIAWDGEALAADRLANSNDLKRTITKIWKINGHLIGCAGTASSNLALKHWFETGRDIEKWPKCQDGDNWSAMLVITPEKRILKYEQSTHPIEYEDKLYAIGSGRDFALAVMHLGHDAIKAVEVASHHCLSCGNGIDILRLD